MPPLCVQALAALQFSTVRARIVPSNDYDDLPERLDRHIAAAVTGLIGFRVAPQSDSEWPANGNRSGCWTPLHQFRDTNRDTNLFTAAASMCGVTLEPTRPTPPSVCAPTDRTPPPVCGLPRPPTGPPLWPTIHLKPPVVGRSALGAQTAKSACSLQDDAHMSRSRYAATRRTHARSSFVG